MSVDADVVFLVDAGKRNKLTALDGCGSFGSSGFGQKGRFVLMHLSGAEGI